VLSDIIKIAALHPKDEKFPEAAPRYHKIRNAAPQRRETPRSCSLRLEKSQHCTPKKRNSLKALLNVIKITTLHPKEKRPKIAPQD